MTIKTTILICSHNGESTITAAIESALAQTTDLPFEVVVVDDGSTDETAFRVAAISRRDERVRLISLAENVGLANACNEGLKHSIGEYLIRLDDDDLLRPNILMMMNGILDNPTNQFDWVGSNRIEFNTMNGGIGIFVVSGTILKTPACGVLMKRKIIKEIGGYNDLFWEEYDLYLRYLRKVYRHPMFLHEPLYTCAARPENPTPHYAAKMKEGWQELIDIWGKDVLIKNGADL